MNDWANAGVVVLYIVVFFIIVRGIWKHTGRGGGGNNIWK